MLQQMSKIRYVQGRQIIRVPVPVVTLEFIAPHMAADATVIIDRPALVPQGLRLGDWSKVDAASVPQKESGE